MPRMAGYCDDGNRTQGQEASPTARKKASVGGELFPQSYKYGAERTSALQVESRSSEQVSVFIRRVKPLVSNRNQDAQVSQLPEGGLLCREGDVAGEGLAPALPPLRQVQQDAVVGVPR
uniref:Cysteine-rich protein 2 n=1 Tax=Tetraodon nigroviridis TaxID=99883 RepID=H3DPM3_TETNG